MTDKKYVMRVPTEASGRHQVLADQPPFWEYLLFGSWLIERQAALEPKWRDYLIDYVVPHGPAIAKSEVLAYLTNQIDLIDPMVENVMRVFSEKAQVSAFGAPGEPGDPNMIEHLAVRLMDIYEALLNWSADLRGARVPSEASTLCLTLSRFSDEPLRKIRAFVLEFVEQIERGLQKHADDDEEPIEITIRLSLQGDPETIAAYNKELKRLTKYFRKP